MRPAEFALEHIFYPEIVVKANPDFNRDAELEQSEQKLKIQVYKLDDHRFQMAMDFVKLIESEADPYELQAFAVATFLTNPDHTEEEQTKTLAKSGPNIIYGALRDHFATVTARAPWKEYYLPAVMIDRDDFYDPESDGQ